MAASPSSSPRLPSPPPIAEDQISPSAGPNDEHGQLGANMNLLNDAAAIRRIRPGTKAEDMHEGPPLVELADIDSAFQLTEHLKALHNSYTHPPESPTSETPIDKETARLLATPPPGVDRGIWLYELCRFLTQKANAMVIGLFSDDPACSATTCPEMRASEWQYLCAAHEPPKSCCAIDYCCHTLDWCATSLTSTKLFPSRLSLGTESASAQIQIRKMTEVFRRVYRIFAHAWFSHRDAFWRVEAKTGLYQLFKTVCDEYRLIQEDNYTIPPEAEGIDTTPVASDRMHNLPSLLRRDTVKQTSGGDDGASNTTKRHKHSLSTVTDRSTSVSTVIHEEVEEDDDDLSTSPDHEVEGAASIVVLADEAEKPEEEQGENEVTEIEDTAPTSMGEYPPTYDHSEGQRELPTQSGDHALEEAESEAEEATEPNAPVNAESEVPAAAPAEDSSEHADEATTETAPTSKTSTEEEESKTVEEPVEIAHTEPQDATPEAPTEPEADSESVVPTTGDAAADPEESSKPHHEPSEAEAEKKPDAE